MNGRYQSIMRSVAVVVVVLLSISTADAKEMFQVSGEDTKASAAEALIPLEIITSCSKNGTLYKDFIQLSEEQTKEFWEQASIEEKYLFMILLRYDFIQTMRKEQPSAEQMDFYLASVQKVRAEECREDMLQVLEKTVVEMLCSTLQPEERIDITTYPQYQSYMERQSAFPVNEMLLYMEAIFLAENEEAFRQSAEAWKTYAENLKKQPEIKPEPKSEKPADIKPEPKSEKQPDIKPESKSEKPADIKLEPKSEKQPEIAPESKSEKPVEIKPEPKSEKPADIKPESKSEKPAEIKPELKSEKQPEIVQESKSENPTEIKPESKSEKSAEEGKAVHGKDGAEFMLPPVPEPGERKRTARARSVSGVMDVRMYVASKPGYHRESCGSLCVTEICAGPTYTKNIGQWYDVCGVCQQNGYLENDWLYITEALDEYYACAHLGEVLIGNYRTGYCTQWGGNATLDTRKHSYSHPFSFCKGHDKPNAYSVSYKANGGSGSMGDTKFTYDKAGKLIKNKFSKTGSKFLGWSKSPKSTSAEYKNEASVKNLTTADKGIVSLYAVWQESITIRYKRNKALGGTEISEEITALKAASGYSLKPNKSFTSFAKANYIFAGWAKRDTVKSYDPEYYRVQSLPSKISYQELKNIAAAQKTTPVGAVSLQVTFYAVWDALPKLQAGNILEFYEGENVTKAMLLSNIKAVDEEAAALKKPLSVRITQLTYADGKLVSGKPAKGTKLSWPSDMPTAYTLDTWYLQFQKNKSPAIHKILFETTDAFGNRGVLEWKVKVKYNEFPKIQTNERYFTLEEARTGRITMGELLRQLTASDLEDGNVTGKIRLSGANEQEFLQFQESGFVRLNAAVTDRFKKETWNQFLVHVIKDGETPADPKVTYVRFINQENYEKNEGVDLSALKEPEIKAMNKNGGMQVTSRWYREAPYRNAIKKAFQNSGRTSKQGTWTFLPSDVRAAKEYMKKQGTAGVENGNSRDGFLQTFGRLRT